MTVEYINTLEKDLLKIMDKKKASFAHLCIGYPDGATELLLVGHPSLTHLLSALTESIHAAYQEIDNE